MTNIPIRLSILASAFLAGCVVTPPPLPPNNPADPQVRGSVRTPPNLLVADETTIAVERQLSSTQAQAEGSQKMEHDMSNMSGMQHGDMQHGEMKTEPQSGATHEHKEMPMQNADAEKKALANQMEKTSQEMKTTAEELKEKSKQTKPAAMIYTCPVHPQIQQHKPGNCPICGMKLVPKKTDGHEGH